MQYCTTRNLIFLPFYLILSKCQLSWGNSFVIIENSDFEIICGGKKMRNLQKLTALALTVVMAASLTACGTVAENTVFSVDDMCGKKIGVQLGTTGDIYASDFEDLKSGVFPEDYNGNASKVERFQKGADAVQSLKQGKIDCVIIDQEPAKAFVSKNTDLTILDEKFTEEEYAICVSKKNSQLTEQINTALAELKEEGILDSIIANYIGDNTKGKSPYVSPEGTDRSNGTLTMATNAAFEPYEYMEGGEIVGIDADIAQAICDKLGYELKIDNIEFDAIINAVQSGRADFGAAGMTVTEDRLANIDFTDTYATATQVIIVRK